MKIRLGDLRRIIREAVEDSQKYEQAVQAAADYYSEKWSKAKASDPNVGVVAGADVEELPSNSAWRKLSVEERSFLLTGMGINSPELQNKPKLAALKQAMQANPSLSDKLEAARQDPRFKYYMSGLQPNLTTQTSYDVLAYQR